MYCPKCKDRYIDGSTKCKKCNMRLVAKLPKEKIIKKKTYGVNIEKLKHKKRIKILVNSFYIIMGIGFLYLLGYNLLVNANDNQNAIIGNEIISCLLGATVLIWTSIGLYLGVDIWEEGKELNIRNKAAKVIVKRILPIIITSFAIYLLIEPTTDYILKDYQTIYGTVDTIMHTKLDDELYIGDEIFYFNENVFENINEGNSYTFTYAKRTKVILDVK